MKVRFGLFGAHVISPIAVQTTGSSSFLIAVLPSMYSQLNAYIGL